MLITTIEELNGLLPSNVLQQADSLLTLMEQTERSYIIPIVGKPLYKEVLAFYASLQETDEGKTEPLAGSPDEKWEELVNLLQVPLVYMTLANNPGLLSVSLNAGGMNAVSADGYDAAGKDSREAFARDCYMNAHRGTEQVLLYLEEDAQSDNPLFLNLWMQSPYFYKQNGLLLRTADDFERYVSINMSRETFLSLVPAIRNIQDGRIRPELGDRLTDALVQFTAFGAQTKLEEGGGDPAPESTNPSNEAKQETQTLATDKTKNEWDYVSSSAVSDDAFMEDLRSYLPLKRYDGMTPGERYKLRIWHKVIAHLSAAIAFFVEDGDKKIKRAFSLNDAMRSLEAAKQLIVGNTAAFIGVIEESPLFVPESQGGEASGSTENKDNSTPKASDSGNTEQEGFIHDPFGTFYS